MVSMAVLWGTILALNSFRLLEKFQPCLPQAAHLCVSQECALKGSTGHPKNLLKGPISPPRSFAQNRFSTLICDLNHRQEKS
jgi:hypothetical protein